MGPDSSWHEIEDVFAAVERDETRRTAEHHRWLEDAIDAQALRGRDGVAALARDRNGAGSDIPTPTLQSCLEIVRRMSTRAHDHRPDREL
jgi:hypothetical protein